MAGAAGAPHVGGSDGFGFQQGWLQVLGAVVLLRGAAVNPINTR